MERSNRANLATYRRWAPFYDALLGRLFLGGRRRAMELLAARPGERVLFVGVGTGADLPFLPAGVSAVGLDLSPAMLAHAQARRSVAAGATALLQADAQLLPVMPRSFDAVVLNLVLSVVPDGARGWREAVRAVRPGGRLILFDKFLPDDAQPGVGRRLLNHLAMIAGTDVNRRLGDLTAGTAFTIRRDEPSLFGGAYRVLWIELPNAA